MVFCGCVSDLEGVGALSTRARPAARLAVWLAHVVVALGSLILVRVAMVAAEGSLSDWDAAARPVRPGGLRPHPGALLEPPPP